jgi:hypothetical protein
MSNNPTLADIKAATDSPNAVCCFCGDPVPKSEALTLTVTRAGSAGQQRLWAHVNHLEAAIAPSRIMIEPEELRTGRKP